MPEVHEVQTLARYFAGTLRWSECGAFDVGNRRGVGAVKDVERGHF